MFDTKREICIFWFRRDLRLEDNAALFRALTSGYQVLPIFIFDKNILNQFEKGKNAQVEFIHKQLISLKTKLQRLNSSIIVTHSTPCEFFKQITDNYSVKAVYANEDYELLARKRDTEIERLLNAKEIQFHTCKDQVIFSKDDILKDDGAPYTVFTPYSRKWNSCFKPEHIIPYNCEVYFNNFVHFEYPDCPSLSELGYESSRITFPSSEINEQLIQNYNIYRDYPALEATSRLSIHLRFGTISIRKLVSKAYKLSDIFLNELIWREFYFAITWHFPHIADGYSFKRKYDDIAWRNNEDDFKAWCEGKTGYPFVDAGMRQLNATGFMHNRARMITASFLAKHLLIDWRWGEHYFANKLLDFDFSANNGGWQWAAGSGCDAAPYFRIFNPELQALKFDKERKYIQKWVPEINTNEYPKPIVDHEFARNRALEVYQKALKD